MNIIALNLWSEKKSQFSADEILDLWMLLEYQKSDFYTADKQILDSLIKVFAMAYWDSDTTLNPELLLSLFKELYPKQQQIVIEALINNCLLLPAYIGFANDLMVSLPADLQKEVKIYPQQQYEDGTGAHISSAEFNYRQRMGLGCEVCNGIYYRPITHLDYDNFYTSLQIAMLSGKETYLFIK